MFATATAKLPDGNEILYTDSGPVQGSSDYTTLIVLHGSAFNDSFHRLHNFAASRNLRTVILNRKDYAGSSRYTDAELDDLQNGRRVFLDRIGSLVAHFLKHFVETQRIPEISEDRKTGGLAILGWSMGATSALPMFSGTDMISKDTYIFLHRYVKDLVLHDPPYLAFGIELPPIHSTYNPWNNPEARNVTERFVAFNAWVSSYFDFPDNWDGDINKLDPRKRAEHASIDKWTPEELALWCDNDTAIRSEFHMFLELMQPTIHAMSNQALYDEKVAQDIFPETHITIIAALRSNWHCVWGCHKAQQRYDELRGLGKRIRPTSSIVLEKANHFIHIDSPEELLDAVVKSIRCRLSG